MTTWVIPLVILAAMIYGIRARVPVFTCFIEGAAENLKACAELAPTLIGLVTCVGMVQESGALDLLTGAFSDVLSELGFPPECLPLALIRPLSGSGALAFFEELTASCGPDSFAGRTAAVMMGSTETTFYTVSVYYAAAGIKKTGGTIPAALIGDLTGFILSALAVRLMFGM